MAAEQTTQDVVKEAQSMGGIPPIDDSAPTTQPPAAAAIVGDGDGTAKKPPPHSSSDAKTATENPAARDAAADAVVVVEAARGGHRVSTPLSANAQEGAEDGLRLSSGGDLSGGLRATASVVDLSGGSDTDSSKADPSKDGAGHGRANSLKKPPTFKSVSVTKSFLAKTATASPVVKGAVDGKAAAPLGGAGAAAQSSLRPRLVAKSGPSGLTHRSALKANGAAGGPDASKVWNKNRPVQPPPPRQFTDEELKLQYGIHMATRLEADDGGQDSKWADIDDEDDDWAPENIEWMDGTKSCVVAVESTPLDAPTEENKAVEEEKEAKAEVTKPPVEPCPSSTSGTKTILKPGAHAAQAPSFNSSKPLNGLVLKGAPEKATLVAKPAAAVPVKSPWAPLPPVDKVPPVAPPVQSPPPSRFAQRDPHGFDSLPPASAAKEIAADDFNRAWRPQEEHHNRTLFDSKSGRYEPVSDAPGGRRGQTREHGVRQPALLQRPGAPHDGRAGAGPAEPSAAFQTSRSSADGNWPRRRASSSVSGGSGIAGAARRMSIGRPHDGGPMGPPAASAPLDSDARPMRDSPTYAHPHPHPLGGGGGGVGVATPGPATATPRWSRPSPAAGPATTTNTQPVDDGGQKRRVDGDGSAGQGQTPAAVAPAPVDAVAAQQRLMREKIERARQAKQRQLEEEKREEGARQERLKLKLLSLAPAPAPAPATPATPAASASSAPAPASPATGAGDTKLEASSVGQDASGQPHARARTRQRPNDVATTNNTTTPTNTNTDSHSPSKLHPPLSTSTPPKPPLPSSDGSITQYGLIKLHQPHTLRKPTAADTPPFAHKTADAPSQPPCAFPPQSNIFSQRPAPSQHRTPHRPMHQPTNNFARMGNDSASAPTGAGSTFPKDVNVMVPPLAPKAEAPKPAAALSGWEGASSRNHSETGNIWGPSGGSRGLGNGVINVSSKSVGTPPPAAKSLRFKLLPAHEEMRKDVDKAKAELDDKFPREENTEGLNDRERPYLALQKKSWGEPRENEQRRMRDLERTLNHEALARERPLFRNEGEHGAIKIKAASAEYQARIRRLEGRDLDPEEFERVYKGRQFGVSVVTDKNGNADHNLCVFWEPGYGPRVLHPEMDHINYTYWSITSENTGKTRYPLLEAWAAECKVKAALDRQYDNLAADLEMSVEAVKAMLAHPHGKSALHLLVHSQGPAPEASSYELEQRNTASTKTVVGGINVTLPSATPTPRVKMPTHTSDLVLLVDLLKTAPARKDRKPLAFDFLGHTSDVKTDWQKKFDALAGKVDTTKPKVWLPPHERRPEPKGLPVPAVASSTPIYTVADVDATTTPVFSLRKFSQQRTTTPRPIGSFIANNGPRGRTPVFPKVAEARAASSQSLTRTKQSAEDDFPEDREFGSRPVLNLPKTRHGTAHLASLPPTRNVYGRASAAVDAQSVRSFTEAPSPTAINVRLLGQAAAKVVNSAPTRDAGRDVRGRKSARGGVRRGVDSGRPGGRKPSSNVALPLGQASSPAANSPRTPRGGYRGGRGAGFGGRTPSGLHA